MGPVAPPKHREMAVPPGRGRFHLLAFAWAVFSGVVAHMAKRRIPAKLWARALGATLWALRRERGLTQHQVAQGLGCGVAFYRDLEQGRLKRNDPRRRAFLTELEFARRA